MINRQEHPVGWSLMLYDLADAHEHLGNLLKDMAEDLQYGEPELRVDLGHIFAHLNRAWYRRNIPEDFPDSDREIASAFPSDLAPMA